MKPNWRAQYVYWISKSGAAGGVVSDHLITNASSELHLLSSTGFRRPLGERWRFAATLYSEHHLTDYQIRDTVSGLTGTIGSRTPIGASATFSYRF